MKEFEFNIDFSDLILYLFVNFFIIKMKYTFVIATLFAATKAFNEIPIAEALA